MRRSVQLVLEAIACVAVGCSDEQGAGGVASHPSMAALAGNYIRLDLMKGLTDSLMLTPDGHFIRKVESATGTWGYEGSVAWNGDILELPRAPDILGRGIIDPEIEGSYRVVAWSDRIYLIEDGAMLQFCNAVNAGRGPRDDSEGNCFLRNRDWLKPVSGLPKVPAPWTEMLLGSPLEGRIDELPAAGCAWVGLGAIDGLRPGMLLTLHDMPMSQKIIDLGGPTTCNIAIELVTIEDHRSLVRPSYPKTSAPITVGMRVTSGWGIPP